METIEWIGPAGSITLHTDPIGSYFVGWNLSGRYSPPVSFDEESVPERDGARLRDVFHGPRDLTLPVWVQGSSESDLQVKVRALASSTNPKRGAGFIRVSTPVGDQREIECRVSNFDVAERIGDTTGVYAQLVVAVFRAHKPYWRDASATTTAWGLGEAPGGWFPFDGFPNLSSSEIFSSDTVVNAGDVDTFPVWTITGRATFPVLRNLTTGKVLDLNYDVLTGDVVTIDTDRKTITNTAGTNLFPDLSSTSSFWALQPGNNLVQVEAGGASATMQVQLSRNHQYLSV